MSPQRTAIVIVASTRAAAGIYEDRSGPIAVDFLRRKGFDCPATLGDLVVQLGKDHTGTTAAGMSLKEVLGRCSFLIDGAGNTAMDSPLAGVTRVDVLPPFAGG